MGVHRIDAVMHLAAESHVDRSIAGAEDIPDLRQAQELLQWLDDGNFTFLGYKEYDLVTDE